MTGDYGSEYFDVINSIMNLSEHLGVLTSGQSENMREELEFRVQELELATIPRFNLEKEILITCMEKAVNLLENPLKGIFKQLFALANNLLSRHANKLTSEKQSNSQVLESG